MEVREGVEAGTPLGPIRTTIAGSARPMEILEGPGAVAMLVAVVVIVGVGVVVVVALDTWFAWWCELAVVGLTTCAC